MNKEQVSFSDIREGDKLILEGGYSTSEPVTALVLAQLPDDAGLYAGQWAWYFRESAPLVGQRCFIGETTIYRVILEDPYEYAVEWTVRGSDVPVPIQEVNWVQRGSAERMIEFNERMFPDKMEKYTVRLVKRRKAGEIEDV